MKSKAESQEHHVLYDSPRPLPSQHARPWRRSRRGRLIPEAPLQQSDPGTVGLPSLGARSLPHLPTGLPRAGVSQEGCLTPAIGKNTSDNQQQHFALSTSPPFWSVCVTCAVGLSVAYPLPLTACSQKGK